MWKNLVVSVGFSLACGLKGWARIFLGVSLWEIFAGFGDQGFFSAFFVAGSEGQSVELSEGMFGFASLMPVVVDVVGGVHGELGDAAWRSVSANCLIKGRKVDY